MEIKDGINMWLNNEATPKEIQEMFPREDIKKYIYYINDNFKAKELLNMKCIRTTDTLITLEIKCNGYKETLVFKK